ncbi:MAG: hypothetical protein SFW62_06805 [Alphaproteobacteria bacterium]|nr:hypothetical protein [Alphaproteobacteria bacterium]
MPTFKNNFVPANKRLPKHPGFRRAAVAATAVVAVIGIADVLMLSQAAFHAFESNAQSSARNIIQGNLQETGRCPKNLIDRVEATVTDPLGLYEKTLSFRITINATTNRSGDRVYYRIEADNGYSSTVAFDCPKKDSTPSLPDHGASSLRSGAQRQKRQGLET